MSRANIIWVILVIVAGIFCLGCRSGAGGGNLAIVSNISFEDFKGDEVFIALQVSNNLSEMQECYLMVNMSQKGAVIEQDKVYVGLLNPANPKAAYNASELPGFINKKLFTLMMNGSTEVKITPWCTQIRKDSVNQSGYSLESIEAGLAGSCDKLDGLKENFICNLLKDKKIGESNIRECFDGRSLELSFFCLAFLTQDYKICNNIVGPISHRCLAFVMHDPDLCGVEQEGVYNDICYAEMAVSTSDKSLCASIKNKKAESDCSIALTETNGMYNETNSSASEEAR